MNEGTVFIVDDDADLRATMVDLAEAAWGILAPQRGLWVIRSPEQARLEDARSPRSQTGAWTAPTGGKPGA